ANARECCVRKGEPPSSTRSCLCVSRGTLTAAPAKPALEIAAYDEGRPLFDNVWRPGIKSPGYGYRGNVDPDERKCLIALHLMPSLGPVRILRLIQALGSACAAANAGEEDLAAVSGIGPRLAARFVRKRPSLDAGRELRRAAAAGARVLTWLDAGYPARLRDLHDAPPVLYL